MYFSEIETVAYYRDSAVPGSSSEAGKPLAEVAWSALPEKVRRIIRTAGALCLEGDYPDSRKEAQIETEMAVFSGNGKSVRLLARDRRIFELIENHVVHQRVGAVFQALETAVRADSVGGEAGIALLGDLPEPLALPVIPDWLEPIEFARRPYADSDFESVLAKGAEAAQALRSLVEWAADTPDAVDALPADYTMLRNAFLLLGDLRDKASFPAIIRFLSSPESVCDLELSTVITSELPEIFARTYNGDFALLAGLIENEKACEYCRASAVDALTLLCWDGFLPRERVAAYLGELFQRRETWESYELFGPLVRSVADLRIEELAEPAERAFSLDMVNPEEIDEAAFLSTLRSEEPPDRQIAPDEPLWRAQLSCHWLTEEFLTEQADEARWLRECEENAERELSYRQQEEIEAGGAWVRPTPIAPVPFVAPQKPGRNDPCSCGSGKKYKKCCGRVG